MKLLTVVIPAYNTEKYLSRCLDSLSFDESVLNELQIIIVNDGSTDQTLDLAKIYEKKFSGAVSVISKKNGGHGSAVNCGFKAAIGKYFKVIDSDDWVNIDDFAAFVKSLKEIQSDIVVSNYIEDHLYDDTTRVFTFNTHGNLKQPIENIVNFIDDLDFFFRFSMHSMTIKTKSLQKVWGDGLLEKTFYVDQQYVAKVLECAKDYCMSDFDIYRYFIGRPEQSVGLEGFWRHRSDHERVLRWLLNEQSRSTLNPSVRTVLQKQISLMLKTHYEIYYQNFKATNDSINELLQFNQFLEENFSQLHRTVSAASNAKHRLSPLRRKLKRKFLCN